MPTPILKRNRLLQRNNPIDNPRPVVDRPCFFFKVLEVYIRMC